jgi:hypothetical protein
MSEQVRTLRYVFPPFQNRDHHIVEWNIAPREASLPNRDEKVSPRKKHVLTSDRVNFFGPHSCFNEDGRDISNQRISCLHVPLLFFVRNDSEKHSDKWPVDELALAAEFVVYFGVPPMPRLTDFEDLARRLAIDLSVAHLPKGVSGYNCRYKERNSIVLEPLEGSAKHAGIPEHTFLHEMRELLEYEFRQHEQATAHGADLESRAEQFASAVRIAAPMPLWTDMGKSALEIKSAWRYVVVGLVIALATFHSLGCLLLPRHEEYFRKMN